MRKLLPGGVVVLGLTLGTIGCITSHHGSADSDHSAHANHAKLELNDGKKWVVPKPMMVHIRNLEKAVQDFERTPKRDDSVLAKEIQENLGRLVTNCTMKGKAHDELHQWLMPFLALTTDYSNATDSQMRQQKLGEIKQALLAFNRYFE
jgi:hypothetical protein